MLEFWITTFMHTIAFVGVGILSISTWIYLWYAKKNKVLVLPGAIRNYSSNLQGHISTREHWASAIIIFLLGCGASMPYISSGWSTTHATTLDVVFVLDVSKSMLARDAGTGEQSRIHFARDFMRNMVQKHPEYRYALITFAGHTNLLSPLTADSSRFSNILEHIGSTNIRSGGTNLDLALQAGAFRFLHDSQKHHRVVVLLSDGGDSESSPNFWEIKKFLQELGIKIISVGIGGWEEVLIPLYRFFGRQYYQLDKEWNPVFVKLYEDHLKALARIGNGIYFSTSNSSYQKTFENFLQSQEHAPLIQASYHKNGRFYLHIILCILAWIVFYFFFSPFFRYIFYIKKT